MAYKSKHIRRKNNPSLDVAIRSGIITASAILIIVCGYFMAFFFSGGH